ncbi:MAG: monooxygenase [Herpetosiphonaceae bacterium]|nr:MAG: monooxygenase [Herpetosiphonaceae bacterium]
MSHNEETILIIGGGIGGVAAALALSSVGFPVRVFERAPQLREVGAGLALWSNAMRVLDQLGVGERIRQIAMPLRYAEVCTWGGSVLSRVGIEQVIGQGAANYVMHRAELHAAIAERLPAGVIETGAECVSFEQSGVGVIAHFKGREPARGSLLIGADGIHSVVRAALWGADRVRYSGQTCYRGIALMAPPDPYIIREVWGPGRRAGICPLDERRVYWWLALNAPAGERDDPARRRDFLLEQFSGWPFALPQLIAATNGDILRNDLIDRRPLQRWSSGRVTLLGDAAHPMLPNLGQGACTAIEDALVLARSIARYGPTAEALRRYEHERIGRTTRIVRQSWRMGGPVRWRNPLALRLREMLVRAIPAPILAQQLREQIGFDVGPLRQANAPRSIP